jgi:hypothetical protein
VRNHPESDRSRARGSGRRHLLTRTAALAGSLALVAAGIAAVTATNSQAAASATVTVNTASDKTTIPQMGQGLNMAVWEGHMNDADQPALLKGAGIRALRYPGGSYGDLYHWKDNSVPGGYAAPNTGFDAFMTTAKAAGAQPVLIANYGSGTAQEAADWVTYANKTKGYGVKHWEIGNEIYGNGYYGAGWEKDDHADKSPKAYATNALEYISKMKAVDPSIKIGIVLTTPGNWPDGQKAGSDTADWNNTVLSIVGDKADFGIIHWYPSPKSAADSLGKPAAEISTMTSSLRSLYSKYKVGDMGIAVTEMNAGYQNNSATAGLFAADSYLTWFENGVFNLDWWNLRNGNDGKTGTNDDGTTDYNEAGIVSVGGTGQPPLNTPFPTYYGLAMAGRIGKPGDTLVSATSSSPQLVAHAVRTAAGGVNVMLINEDLANSTNVSLNYAGITASGNVTVEQWKKGATGISSSTQASAGSITVPPYSITLLKIGSSDGSGTPPATTPPTNTTPAPTNTTPVPTNSTPAVTPTNSTPAVTPTTGQTTNSAPTGGSTVSPGTRAGALRGVGSHRCLQAAGSAIGSQVTIADCNGSAGQQWTLTSNGALQVYGGRCLGVPAGKVSRGTRVRIDACTGAANQQWTFQTNASLVNRQTGMYLDVFNRRTAGGTPVIVWSRTGATNQQWVWS